MSDTNLTLYNQDASNQLRLADIYLRDFFASRMEKLRYLAALPALQESPGQFPSFAATSTSTTAWVSRCRGVATAIAQRAPSARSDTPNVTHNFTRQ